MAKRDKDGEKVVKECDNCRHKCGLAFECPCKYVIYTGGAPGTDFLVEQCALQHGMHVKVRVGPSHPRSRKPQVIKPHVTPLTHQELAEAKLYIERANKTLKRSIFGLSPYVTELLQRNYWIIKKAKCIYAFGEFEGSSPEHLFGDYTRVKGGTGWAVQMGMDFGMGQKGVYVYNTRDHRRYEQKWRLRQPPIVNESCTFFYPMKYDCAPSIDKASAIVGSREMDEETQEEIRSFFGRNDSSARVYFIPNRKYCQSDTHYKEYLDDE